MNTKTKTKKKTIVIDEKQLTHSNVKARVTAWIDGDILLELRRRAKKRGIGYQTFMNTVLRQTLIDSATLEERIERIEEHLKLD